MLNVSGAPAFCSLEDAFKLSGEPDKAQFLAKLRRLCGLGTVVALGKKHATIVNRDDIPATDWATYRLHFWNGGCAIPENGDDFLDAIAITNLHEGAGSNERTVGWCDIRFRTEEIIGQIWDVNKPEKML